MSWIERRKTECLRGDTLLQRHLDIAPPALARDESGDYSELLVFPMLMS